MAHGSILNQTAGNSLLLDGSKAMEANLNMGNHSIINLAASTSNASAVRRDQLTATNTTYSNSSTSSIITSTNVQGAIDQLFTSVSNGKELIADAITDKGVTTSASASFQTMANNIGRISTGYQVISATDSFSFTRQQVKTITSLSFSSSNWPTLDRILFLIVYPEYNSANSSRSYISAGAGSAVNYPLYFVYGSWVADGDGQLRCVTTYDNGGIEYETQPTNGWELTISGNYLRITSTDTQYYDIQISNDSTLSLTLYFNCICIFQ